MLVYIYLFLSFIQVSMLGIGGNASSQALLEHEIITLHHWLTPEQMANCMFACRLLPGSTGYNTAILSSSIAASALGFWGCILACLTSTAAMVIPSCLWTSLYTKLQTKRHYQSFYDCAMVVLRPLIPGLIAAAAIIMMRADNFGSVYTTPWDFGVSIFLFIATLIGVLYFKISAMFMIVLCGVTGWILF